MFRVMMHNNQSQKKVNDQNSRDDIWKAAIFKQTSLSCPKFRIMKGIFFNTDAALHLYSMYLDLLWFLVSCEPTHDESQKKEQKAFTYVLTFVAYSQCQWCTFWLTLNLSISHFWLHIHFAFGAKHLVWHPGNRAHQNNLVLCWQTTRNRLMTHFSFFWLHCSKFTQILASDCRLTDWMTLHHNKSFLPAENNAHWSDCCRA